LQTKHRRYTRNHPSPFKTHRAEPLISLVKKLGGGLPTSTNRTLWPLTGAAPVILQPGHQANHDWGMLWVNIGLGTQPANFSTQMMPEFSFTFPSDKAYESQICLPDVTLPEPVRGAVKEGDNATIQIVETAKHGGSLYSVSVLKPLCSKST